MASPTEAPCPGCFRDLLGRGGSKASAETPSAARLRVTVWVVRRRAA